MRASFLTAYRIEKSKKPHSIGEELTLPSAIEMCRLVVGEAAACEVAKIPRSDNIQFNVVF